MEEPGLFILEKRRLEEDLRAAFKYLKDHHVTAGLAWVCVVPEGRSGARGGWMHGRKSFLTMRTVPVREGVPSLEAFSQRLDTHLLRRDSLR